MLGTLALVLVRGMSCERRLGSEILAALVALL